MHEQGKRNRSIAKKQQKKTLLCLSKPLMYISVILTLQVQLFKSMVHTDRDQLSTQILMDTRILCRSGLIFIGYCIRFIGVVISFCVGLTVCSHCPTPRPIQTDKNGLHRIVWRCSHCTETDIITDSHYIMLIYRYLCLSRSLCLTRCQAVSTHHKSV